MVSIKRFLSKLLLAPVKGIYSKHKMSAKHLFYGRRNSDPLITFFIKKCNI